MAKTADIKVYGLIGKKRNSYDTNEYTSGAQFEAAFATALASDAEEINFRSSSAGGSVSDGNLMLTTCMKSTKPVKGMIDGFAASMGYFALLGCVTISASRNSLIMTHSVQGNAQGSPDELRAEAVVLDKFNSTIAEILSKRTGLSVEEATAKFLSEEAWFTAEEALAAKLIDNIDDYDAENVPVITAGMKYADAFERFVALHQAKPEEALFERLGNFLKEKFGLKERQAMELSDGEEWFLQYQISILQNSVDNCESCMENCSNPQICAYSKEEMARSSANIIVLVTLLYGEEQQDAAATLVKDIMAKVKDKTGNALSTTQIIAAAEEFLKPKLKENADRIAQLEVDLVEARKKPAAQPSKVSKAGDNISASHKGTLDERVEDEFDIRNAQLKEVNEFSFTTHNLND